MLGRDGLASVKPVQGHWFFTAFSVWSDLGLGGGERHCLVGNPP